MTDIRYIYLRIVELHARRKALREFIMNRDANFEANILDSQIDALKKELREAAIRDGLDLAEIDVL
jgi:hypothetical protein